MYYVLFIILNLPTQLCFTYVLYKCVFTNKLSNVAKRITRPPESIVSVATIFRT